MTSDRLLLIRSRLVEAFSPESVEVIDESSQHVGHAGHQGGGRHFAIIISANHLKKFSRVDQHRQIYALFEDMIPEQIHALRIVVK